MVQWVVIYKSLMSLFLTAKHAVCFTTRRPHVYVWVLLRLCSPALSPRNTHPLGKSVNCPFKYVTSWMCIVSHKPHYTPLKHEFQSHPLNPNVSVKVCLNCSQLIPSYSYITPSYSRPLHMKPDSRTLLWRSGDNSGWDQRIFCGFTTLDCGNTVPSY